MHPFLEWVIALTVGVIMAIIGLFIAAFAATYCSIWVAGAVLFLLFFGAIAGLYFVSDRNER